MVFYTKNAKVIRAVLKIVVFILFTQLSYAQYDEEIDSLIGEFQKVKHSNLNKALELVKRSDSLSNLNSTNHYKSEVNYYLSEIYCLLLDYKKSKHHANLALKFLNNNEVLKARIYNSLSNLELIGEELSKAFEFFEKAKNKAINSKNKYVLAEVLFNGYFVFNNRGDKKEALKLLNQALDIAKNINNVTLLAKIYNAKGYEYISRNKDSLMYYYKLSLKNAKLSNNKIIESIVKINLGDFYLDIENFPLAYKNLMEGKLIAEHIKDKKKLFLANFNLGRYYEFINDYDKAVYYYDIALNFYGMYVAKESQSLAYYLIAGAYEHIKDYKSAFEYQTKYSDLNKELELVQKAKEFDAIRTKYDVEKKNNQITLLEIENQLAATKSKWIIISSILLTLPLIALFVFYKHRAKTQQTIRIQEKEIYNKEKLRLQKEQELAEVKALIEGQDKERHRIANELHDGVGGQLASVTMGLSHINYNLKSPEIKALGETLSKTFNELRELSHNLSTNYLKDKTLEDLIANLKTQYESTNNFKIEISIFPDHILNTIKLEVKHHLYRILQEVLTNCSKYAKAKLIQLSFNKHDDNLVVMIEDDGAGFDLNKNKNGIGLKNIKERVNSLAGSMNIESTPNIGTHITIEIPLNTN